MKNCSIEIWRKKEPVDPFVGHFYNSSADNLMRSIEILASDDEYLIKIHYPGKTAEYEGRTEGMEFVRSCDDIGKRPLMKTLEDAGGVEGKIDRIGEFYSLGMKMMSLTWNFENCFGYPNSADRQIMSKGLKKFGFESIEAMNDLGIIIDVSHLSDGGTLDVIAHSTMPVIASHSNARAVCHHPRNLPDHLIRMIADKGGVMGLNLYNLFVSNDSHCSLKNLYRQIEHIRNVGGLGCLAMGTDFDGFEDDGRMEVRDAGEIPRLWDYLRRQGYTSDEIEAIAWKNADRVCRDVLK